MTDDFLAPGSQSKRQRRSHQVFLLSLVLLIILVLIPTAGSSRGPAKNARSRLQLANLVAICEMYHQEYNSWPTLTSNKASPDFGLSLKKIAPLFVQVMSGHPPPGSEVWNRKHLFFATFEENELSSDGNTPVDGYGNDDLVLIFDTDGDGQIAPFTQTLTTHDGHKIIVHQAVPVQAGVIAMSAGAGQSDEDAVTTWLVVSRGAGQ